MPRGTGHSRTLCAVMPHKGKATAGLTELTINCNNIMYWYVYTTDTCITLKKTYKKIHQRTQIDGLRFSPISKV